MLAWGAQIHSRRWRQTRAPAPASKRIDKACRIPGPGDSLPKDLTALGPASAGSGLKPGRANSRVLAVTTLDSGRPTACLSLRVDQRSLIAAPSRFRGLFSPRFPPVGGWRLRPMAGSRLSVVKAPDGPPIGRRNGTRNLAAPWPPRASAPESTYVPWRIGRRWPPLGFRIAGLGSSLPLPSPLPDAGAPDRRPLNPRALSRFLSPSTTRAAFRSKFR